MVVLLLAVAQSQAASRRYTLQAMKRVFRYASSIDTFGVGKRQSYAYLKYDIRINRRNAILLAIPTMFAVANGGGREHIGETYDIIDIDNRGEIQARRLLDRSTIPHQSKTMPTLLKYLTPHVYDEMLVDQNILSPFHYNNRRFYRYKVSPFSSETALVSFRPRLKNTKLVRGWARVHLASGRVIEAAFDGEFDLIRFHIALTMGDRGVMSLLPSECSLNARFLFLGNDITAEYTTLIGLPRILASDTIAERRDTALINRVRPVPLTSHEEYLYHKYYASKRAKELHASQRSGALHTDSVNADTVVTAVPEKSVEAARRSSFYSRLWEFVGRSMLGRVRQEFGARRQGYFRLDPILNPLYFSYSSRRGLTYRLDLRASYYFNDHQALQLRFKAGYAFKQKQFYFNFPFTFYIDRRHNAFIRTEWMSGKHITSSEVVDVVKKEKGDSINWDAMNLTYFRNHSFKLVASYDPTPHWGIELGFVTRKRTALHTDGFAEAGKPSRYTSVAPLFELTYRPRGYNGAVLTLDYERSIRGMMGSNTEYERLEADGQYNWRLSALSSLQMRAGTGFYTHRGKGSYFLDYVNFRENNVPGGWNDEWACSFELLNSNWYNASDYYVRLNAAYETPMMVLAWLPLAGRLIEKERIYVNLLAVRHLNPYVEWGYGFTTRAFSIGAFVSQRHLKFEAATIRFGLELFRHW